MVRVVFCVSCLLQNLATLPARIGPYFPSLLKLSWPICLPVWIQCTESDAASLLRTWLGSQLPCCEEAQAAWRRPMDFTWSLSWQPAPNGKLASEKAFWGAKYSALELSQITLSRDPCKLCVCMYVCVCSKIKSNTNQSGQERFESVIYYCSRENSPA